MKIDSIVTIKGYKKHHIIDGVYILNPPKGVEQMIYHLKNTPNNKRYFESDLILISE